MRQVHTVTGHTGSFEQEFYLPKEFRSFDISFRLEKSPTLIPLHPDTSNSAANLRNMVLEFQYTISSNASSFKAEKLELSYLYNGIEFFKKTSTDNLTPGDHIITWNGYDTNEKIMDTSKLYKQKETDTTEMRIRLISGSKVKEDTISFDNTPHRHWATSKINTASKTIAVDVYLYVQNPQNLSNFSTLKSLLLGGIGLYWSRDITIGADNYRVNTTAHHRDEYDNNGNRIAIGVDIKEASGITYERSGNPDLRIWDATVFYNEKAFINWDTSAGLPNPVNTGTQKAVLDFEMISAHEFGHSVQAAFEGILESAKHNGTSKTLGGGGSGMKRMFPPAGEIDLMVYHKGPLTIAQEAMRTKANEFDVKTLIWLTQIEILESD